MLDKQKIVKFSILSIILLTFIINLANLLYVKYYYNHYGAYNQQLFSAFNDYKYTPKNNITENDYKTLCLSLQPRSFYSNYNKLSDWSGLLMIFSIIAIYISHKNKIFPKKYKNILIVIFLISFVVYFYVGLIEVSYEYYANHCEKYLL
ncbi:hypothetical protein KKB43_06630 [Patescibacteria group bacterium]|nr:hypothetical protein [Patescibacteria group bacterium]